MKHTRIFFRVTANRYTRRRHEDIRRSTSWEDHQTQEAAYRDLFRKRQAALASGLARWIAGGHKVRELTHHPTDWQIDHNGFIPPYRHDADWIGQHVANRCCGFGWGFALIPVDDAPVSRKTRMPGPRGTWHRAYRHARLYNYGMLSTRYSGTIADAAKDAAQFQKGYPAHTKHWNLNRSFRDRTVLPAHTRLDVWKTYTWFYNWRTCKLDCLKNPVDIAA